MIMNDLIWQTNASKREKARKELVLRWCLGLCVATTAASLGVVAGVLVAPKSGEKTRMDLRRRAAKSVASIEKAILGKVNDKATDE